MIRQINRYKVSTLLLTVYFLLLFGGMEFLHSHSGIHNAEVCKVCSLSTTLSNTFPHSKNILLINDSFEIIKSESELPTVSLKSQYPFTGRAPPQSRFK